MNKILIFSYLIITLIYLIIKKFKFIKKSDLVAFVLMLIYILVYINSPILSNPTIIVKWEVIYLFIPIILYIMLLFPKNALEALDIFKDQKIEYAILSLKILLFTIFVMLIFIVYCTKCIM